MNKSEGCLPRLLKGLGTIALGLIPIVPSVTHKGKSTIVGTEIACTLLPIVIGLGTNSVENGLYFAGFCRLIMGLGNLAAS